MEKPSRALPDSRRMECATKSACLSVLSTPVVRKVGVMSVGGSFTCGPNTYTTLERGTSEKTHQLRKPDCVVSR